MLLPMTRVVIFFILTFFFFLSGFATFFFLSILSSSLLQASRTSCLQSCLSSISWYPLELLRCGGTYVNSNHDTYFNPIRIWRRSSLDLLVNIQSLSLFFYQSLWSSFFCQALQSSYLCWLGSSSSWSSIFDSCDDSTSLLRRRPFFVSLDYPNQNWGLDLHFSFIYWAYQSSSS